MQRLLVVSALLLLVGQAAADCYLHNPRGSNNRLDDENRDRDSDDRVFDSQNNNRGGYNVGTIPLASRFYGNDLCSRRQPVLLHWLRHPHGMVIAATNAILTFDLQDQPALLRQPQQRV